MLLTFAVKTAPEMTYIVSSGALNSTPTNQDWVRQRFMSHSTQNMSIGPIEGFIRLEQHYYKVTSTHPKQISYISTVENIDVRNLFWL